MLPNTVRVVAAVVDTRQLTLYVEDGQTVAILQGDPRLKPILDNITPILVQNQVAEVSLDSSPTPSSYAEYEDQSNGLVRFFRVARDSLLSLFGAMPEAQPEPQVLGILPTAPMLSKQEQIQQVLQHAVPVSSPEFSQVPLGKNSTQILIAQVGDQIIPGVERLASQITRATQLSSPKGMNAFMTRLAAIIPQRGHSVEDLLTFLERADLPIAEDGSIIIYKLLTRQNDDTRHPYRDCHTGLVPQRIGSHVCMDPSLVDHDRNNDCSNGLHVARRGYLPGYLGNVIVLAKVAPEDVIAVPKHDPNKMRVCGYHILFELPEDAFQKLKGDQPFTDTDVGQQLLARALSGDHVGRLEEVRITANLAESFSITPLVPPVIGEPVATAVPPSSSPTLVEALPIIEPDQVDKAPHVDPGAVNARVTHIKAESRAEMAQRLYAVFLAATDPAMVREARQALLDHKRNCKLGWGALGLTETQVSLLLNPG